MSSWQHLQIDKYSLNSLLPRTFKNALWIISYDVVHINIPVVTTTEKEGAFGTREQGCCCPKVTGKRPKMSAVLRVRKAAVWKSSGA